MALVHQGLPKSENERVCEILINNKIKSIKKGVTFNNLFYLFQCFLSCAYESFNIVSIVTVFLLLSIH